MFQVDQLAMFLLFNALKEESLYLWNSLNRNGKFKAEILLRKLNQFTIATHDPIDLHLIAILLLTGSSAQDVVHRPRKHRPSLSGPRPFQWNCWKCPQHFRPLLRRLINFHLFLWHRYIDMTAIGSEPSGASRGRVRVTAIWWWDERAASTYQHMVLVNNSSHALVDGQHSMKLTSFSSAQTVPLWIVWCSERRRKSGNSKGQKSIIGAVAYSIALSCYLGEYNKSALLHRSLSD